MIFSDFVFTYWHKPKGKSGKLWDSASVAEMEGMDTNDVQAYFSYCESKGRLTDEQLIALNPVVRKTPFGLVVTDGPTGDVLDLTLDKITLRQLLAAISK